MTVGWPTAQRDEGALRKRWDRAVVKATRLVGRWIGERRAVLQGRPDRTRAFPSSSNQIAVELEILLGNADERHGRDRIAAQHLARSRSREIERTHLSKIWHLSRNEPGIGLRTNLRGEFGTLAEHGEDPGKDGRQTAVGRKEEVEQLDLELGRRELLAIGPARPLEHAERRAFAVLRHP